MEQKQISPGVFLEQEQQAPQQHVPNESINFNMLGPDVKKMLVSDYNLGDGLTIDWNLSNVFYTVRTTTPGAYSFSNVTNGKTIVVIIKNNTGSPFTPSFPSPYLITSPLAAIPNGAESVYTFIRSNSKTYLNAVEGMT